MANFISDGRRSIMKIFHSYFFSGLTKCIYIYRDNVDVILVQNAGIERAQREK